MKKLITFLIFLHIIAFPQSPNFIPYEYWNVSGYGMAFNVEVQDINKDGKQDIIVGNWNDTYVYYGGQGMLDSTVDVTYTGRMLAVCDYNGDGHKDLIAMHFTNYDSSRFDYDGEILFYYGSDTTQIAIDTIPEYSIPLPTLYPTRHEFSWGLDRPGIEYGDFNNDGKYDLVINSRVYPLGLPYGKVYIYMGNDIPPDTSTFSVEGESIPGQPPISHFGEYFQVGDINDDGYDDLLLSSKVNKIPPAPNPTDSLDVLYVYLGGENFEFVKGGESLRYESKLKNSIYSYGWFKRKFSIMDINGDNISDIIITHFSKDSTSHVHFGSMNILDTIPSFYITDPDTLNPDVVVGGTCHDIGDFNNDGYNDFILKESYFKSFTLHLGGPRLSNNNPYGMRGLLEACVAFPREAVNCGDQNGDSVKDFVVISPCGQSVMGNVLIFLGDPSIVTGISEDTELKSFKLLQNFPNPFNSSTNIRYSIDNKQLITIKIYDILGKEVTILINKEQEAGDYVINFNAEKYNLSSGVYFCELTIKDGASSKIKMIYLK